MNGDCIGGAQQLNTFAECSVALHVDAGVMTWRQCAAALGVVTGFALDLSGGREMAEERRRLTVQVLLGQLRAHARLVPAAAAGIRDHVDGCLTDLAGQDLSSGVVFELSNLNGHCASSLPFAGIPAPRQRWGNGVL